MRYYAIALVFALTFAGVFSVAHSHDGDNVTISQVTSTPVPGGLFDNTASNSGASTNTVGNATLFDFTTPPNAEVFDTYNGEVSDGILRLNAPEDDEAYADFYIPAQDYAIDMNLTFLSYSEETIFMYFLLRIQDDFCNLEIVYDPAFGEVFSSVRLLEDCDDWEDLDAVEAPVLNMNQTYNIRVTAQGNIFSLFVDGEEIISVEDETFSAGYVGSIGVIGPAEVNIDNLSVTDLNAAGGTAPVAGGTPAPSGLFDGEESSSDSGSSGGLFDDTPANPTPSGSLFDNN